MRLINWTIEVLTTALIVLGMIWGAGAFMHATKGKLWIDKAAARKSVGGVLIVRCKSGKNLMDCGGVK